LRISKASYGIIKHKFEKEDLYLLRMNTGWGSLFNFISGHIETKDEGDYQKTMIREVEEELYPIKYQKHFFVRLICEEPFQEVSYSLNAKIDTKYTFYIFQIFFFVPIPEISFLWVNEESPNRWFTEVELKMGENRNNEQISSFPVPQIIKFIPGGLISLQDSFIKLEQSRRENAIR
jgi:hypothetical protein